MRPRVASVRIVVIRVGWRYATPVEHQSPHCFDHDKSAEPGGVGEREWVRNVVDGLAAHPVRFHHFQSELHLGVNDNLHNRCDHVCGLPLHQEVCEASDVEHKNWRIKPNAIQSTTSDGHYRHIHCFYTIKYRPSRWHQCLCRSVGQRFRTTELWADCV